MVRSQAGLNRALRHWNEGILTLRVDGHPTAYPAVISISLGFRGYDFIQISCISVNQMQESIKDQ